MNALNITLAAILILFGSFVNLFLMWVLVMHFQRARTEGLLTQGVIAFAYCIAAIGYLCDVWCNLLCTLVFLELPQEYTVSQRLRRLVSSPSAWRRKLAIWFAVTLINPFSVGGPHIVIPAEMTA